VLAIPPAGCLIWAPEALVKAETQQEQSLNNNSGCYGAPLDDVTRCIFPRSPKTKLRSNSAYRMLPCSLRMPHRANPPWYWVGSQRSRDAQVQIRMLPPEQKSKEVWMTWTQLTCTHWMLHIEHQTVCWVEMKFKHTHGNSPSLNALVHTICHNYTGIYMKENLPGVIHPCFIEATKGR